MVLLLNPYQMESNMKWPNDQVQIMLDGFQEFLQNCGYSLDEIREHYQGTPPMKVVWDIARQVQYDLSCDDSHPAYKSRKRRVKHNPRFVLYPKGCHDTHRTTMLKHVAKKVGLL